MGKVICGQYIITEDGAVYHQMDSPEHATHLQFVAYNHQQGFDYSSLLSRDSGTDLGKELSTLKARHSGPGWIVWYMRE